MGIGGGDGLGVGGDGFGDGGGVGHVASLQHVNELELTAE